MASLVIIELIELAEDMEKVKGYWDDKGLDMHIAVKLDGKIAVSTKHWGRTHYLVTKQTPAELWKVLEEVAQEIGRSLIKSDLGPYIFIPKLNVEHTQNIFNLLRSKLNTHQIKRKWELSWDIDDAVLKEFA